MGLLKVVAALWVVLTSAAAGWLVGDGYQRRLVELGSFRAALQLLETEISYGATPLPNALEAVADHYPGPVAAVARGTAGAMRDGTGVPVSTAWQAAIQGAAAGSALATRDWRILLDLGGVLGNSDGDDQVRHLRLAGARLAAVAAEVERQAPGQRRMWQYLGALVGLAVVVALI